LKVVLLLLVGIIGFFPRQMEVCPEWEVVVLDQQNKPAAGVKIRQQWQYYGVSGEQSENSVTDSEGRVRFSARHVRYPLVLSFLGKALGFVAVHSSFGPVVTVRMSAPQSKPLDQSYWDGKLLLEGNSHISSRKSDHLETTFLMVNLDLLDAVDAGDFALAKQLLKENPGVANMKDALGGTALNSLYSTKTGSIEFAKELIAAGCDVKAAGKDSKTALHWAAERGEIELATLFLQNGADVMARIHNPQGITEDLDTPLHSALHASDDDATKIRMITLLLQHGADVNAKARFGETPIFVAAYLSTPAVIKELRANGATTDVKNEDGKTPVDVARQFNKALNIEALK